MGEMPQGMERRMVLQMLAHWRELRGDRTYPSFQDIDPLTIPEIWCNVFVLDLVGYAKDPLFRLAGDTFTATTGASLRNIRISEVPPNTLAEQSVSYYREVIERGVPISRGGEFTKSDGTRVLYRGVILPMSDDGSKISGLLGAANSREAALAA
jgi:hypothetical protein